MGKRIIRIYGKDISYQISNLLNKDAHVVLKNNVTIHGKILKSENDILVVEDLIFAKHRVPTSEISEIYIDKEAPY